MQNIPFQIFAWIASIAFGLEVVGTKFLSKYEIKNPWLFNFSYNGLVLLFTIPIALHYGAGVPPHWTFIIWSGILWALGCIFWLLAIYRLDVTTLSPLWLGLRSMFAIILGGLFLGEVISLNQFFLIVLIIFGVSLVTLNEKISWRSMLNSGVGLSILSMFIFTVWAILIKKAIAVSDFWTATIWMLVIGQIFFCFTLPYFISEIKNIEKKQGLFIFFVAVFDLIGVLASNRAYQENLIISSAIVNLPLSAVMAFLISCFTTKSLENHTWLIYLFRFIGIILIVWAAIKLG